MTYEEFVSIITSKEPSLEDRAKVEAFVENTDIETLWAALNIGGIHFIFVAVINKFIQEKIAAQNLGNSMQAISTKLNKGS